MADEVANDWLGAGRGSGAIHILNLMRNLLLHQRGRVMLTASLGAALGQALLASALLAPVPLNAQEPAPRPPAVVIWHDARLLGAFTLAAAVVMPADREMQRLMQRDWLQQSSPFSHAADVFNAYGSPGVFAGSAVFYATGWATGRPAIARLGLRTGEAIMLSGVVTGGLKGFAGRARPYASPQRPGDWRLLSGTQDGARQSFPSGHATAAFAFATAMDRELRQSYPRTARWAGPALYGAAALTGLARMHSDNHWASDVVMGAGVGIVSGLVVARFHSDRPRHALDRRLLPRAR